MEDGRVGSLLQWIVSLRIFSPIVRPVTRVLVGVIAVPLFRVFLHRVVKMETLDAELTKDLEQWVRGSVLLLLATANVEYALFGSENAPFRALGGHVVAIDDGSDIPDEETPEERKARRRRNEFFWLSLGVRLLLALGVIEAMRDQALFAIIHPGPSRLLFPKGHRMRAIKEQWKPFCKGVICRHLDRTSSVFAIMAVIFGGKSHATVGWVCYCLAIVQFLIIGLVSSRDKALDVLSEFDKQMDARRKELLEDTEQGRTFDL